MHRPRRRRAQVKVKGALLRPVGAKAKVRRADANEPTKKLLPCRESRSLARIPLQACLPRRRTAILLKEKEKGRARKGKVEMGTPPALMILPRTRSRVGHGKVKAKGRGKGKRKGKGKGKRVKVRVGIRRMVILAVTIRISI